MVNISGDSDFSNFAIYLALPNFRRALSIIRNYCATRRNFAATDSARLPTQSTIDPCRWIAEISTEH